MTTWRHRLRQRDCGWHFEHQALVFGGYTGPLDRRVPADGDRYLLGVLALAETPYVQRLLVDAGGSVPDMLERLTEDDRGRLTSALAAIAHPAPDEENVPC